MVPPRPSLGTFQSGRRPPYLNRVPSRLPALCPLCPTPGPPIRPTQRHVPRVRHAGGGAPAQHGSDTPLAALCRAPAIGHPRPPLRRLLLLRLLLILGIVALHLGLDPMEPPLRRGRPGRELRIPPPVPAGGGGGERGFRGGRQAQEGYHSGHRKRRRSPRHGRTQECYRGAAVPGRLEVDKACWDQLGWWVGYAKGIDDSIGRIVRISPGVGRYVAKSYSPRQLVTASSGTPLFEIFLVREDDKTYTMKVVHLRPTKGTLGASSISSAITESPATVETPESSAISDSITEEANIDTPVKGNGDAEEKEQDVGSSKDTSVDGFKSLLNFFKSRIPEFKVQVINVDVSEETELAANSSEESVQDDVKSTPEGSLEEPTTEELEQEEDVPEEDMDEESKSTKVKLFISGVVHNKEDAGTKSYVRVPAEINNMEKDSFDLYIPGNGSGHDLPETKAAKQKVADMAAKLASELMPSDVAKALWGTTKSSSKINKEVQELLRLTLSKARVKLTDDTFFNRIIMDTNSMDPFNGLYVGAFSPYGPEIVQLRRKFGHWNSSDDVEFFEYVEAVKLTGDLSVPAGQITFRAKIGKGKRLENRGAYPEEFDCQL
uniref:Protein EXECUTER 2 chloroplastic n=1 Tax=Zea mays TaxID=4577 RepID=A0A804N129_MAIZE